MASPHQRVLPTEILHGALTVLTVTGIFFLLFTSLPVLPSKYRPVSIFFFIPIGIAFLLMAFSGIRRVPRRDLLLLLFVGMSILYSALLVMAGDLSGALMLRYLAVVMFGTLTYYGMVLGLSIAGPNATYYALHISVIFFVALGFFDIWCVYGHGPYQIMLAISSVIAPDVLESRIPVTTEEASWAALVGLCLLVSYIVVTNLRGRPQVMLRWLLGIVIALTLSLDGFLTTTIMVGLYWAIVHMRKPKWKTIRLLLLMVGALVAASYSVITYINTNKVTAYYAQRIEKLATVSNLTDAVMIDSSVFIRVMYPYFGLQMALDHPLGVGIGGYSDHFKEYISPAISSDTLKQFPEAYQDVQTGQADPKNLWARAVSEQGWLGLALLLAFVLAHLSGGAKSPYWEMRVLLVSYAIASSQNFGSFAFVQFWFVLALARMLEEKNWTAAMLVPNVEKRFQSGDLRA